MTWYFVVGKKDGRGFRAGPFDSDKIATEKGINWCGADFEVIPLETRDAAEAGRRIKYILANRSNNIVEALKKQRIGKTNDNTLRRGGF